mgnify:CR=1 FL=1
MCTLRLPAVLLLITVFFSALDVSSVHANPLPTASTVVLEDIALQPVGTIVIIDEANEKYTISKIENDPTVYGVTMPKPPVLFETEVGGTPVVTEGIAFARVNAEGGTIKRGDLLVSSSQSGVAKRASLDEQYVFAIALEEYMDDIEGSIQVEVGSERAQSVRARKAEIAAQGTTPGEEEERSFSWVRALIAMVIVVGGLFFVLYSFRSTIAHGVISVGRNPRARRSILTLSVANIVFALLLCGVVIFIGIAILVLPL